MDKHVKVWSLHGKLWGDIYLIKESYEKNWSFPYNWHQVRSREVKQVRQVLSQIRVNVADAKKEPIEDIEEVVEFDDDLEHALREQSKKRALQ